MKKIGSVLLCVLLLLTMNACSGKGANASDKAISVGKSAVEVVDNYLDNKIDGKEAGEKLDELYAEMEYVDDLPQDDEHKAHDFLISSDILSLSTKMIWVDYDEDSEAYDEILETRNELAESIGIKKR